MIAPDRPGLGLSDFQPGRRIVDFTEDVRQLSAHLGLTKFTVLGISGGGPYAAACAARIPEQVSSTLLVCSMAPADAPEATVGMLALNRWLFSMAHRYPRVAHCVAGICLRAIWHTGEQPLPKQIEKRLPPAGDPGSLDIQVGPLEILLEKWTAQAPMDATSYLVSLPESARRIQMLSTAAGQWAEQNPRDALAWASSLSSEADRNVAVRGVLAGAAQSDAAAAANLALTLPPGIEQAKGMELIINQWSARAPENLMRWATTQVSDTARQAALPSIVTAWAGADLPTLGDWLNALPAGTARDTCCAALVRHLAPTQPDLARQWADTIGDLSLRQKEVGNLGINHNQR